MRPVLILLMGLAVHPLGAEELQVLSRVTFRGDILSPENISAVAQFNRGEFLMIAGDEGREIQVLRRVAADEYTVAHNLQLAPPDAGQEIDIEGMAFSGERLYVVGSHSLVRAKLKPENTLAANRALLQVSERQPLRDGVFELKLDKRGELKAEIVVKSLRRRIAEDPLLGPFARLPGKENGVDIEAIAAVGDTLYVGFRGPVLREGYVPVLVFDFDEPQKAKTVFVALGGRGIRDMVRVGDGFSLIGGPVHNEPRSFRVYHWKGGDAVAGSDGKEPDVPLSFGEIPLPDAAAKPEGMTVLEETKTHYQVLIVFDGVPNGMPTRFLISK